MIQNKVGLTKGRRLTGTAYILTPTSLFGSLIGPPRTSLMIEQINGDIGEASSLMSCTFTFFGCIGMLIISSDLMNRVVMMGMMNFIYLK